jgi:HK97 family phage portal protein
VRGLLRRSIRPPDPVEPNDNPAGVPPASVGPPDATSGDAHGFILDYEPSAPSLPPPSIIPSAWDGWPAEWWTPAWGRVQELADLAWACVDLNARILSTMPPYIVNGATTLDTSWKTNPDPEIYTSWEEFAKQLFWDWYLGEAFVLTTARYATGWPARFHVVPPWFVNVEMDGGRRVYSIGSLDVTDDMLHLRYKSSVDDAHGHGPLEAGRSTLVAAAVLGRYATTIASRGLIPSSILEAPEDMSPDQAEALRDQWVEQRTANPGYPAVLSGGLKWAPTQLNPRDLALVELAQFTEGRIAVLLGVPPFLVGLPSAGDSMTYSNVTSLFDYHWRSGLRPSATSVMAGLSEWLLPRGTTVEVNKDAYVQPEPLQRAQTAEIYNRIRDEQTGQPVLTVDEIREAERLDLTDDLKSAPVAP